MQTFSLAVVLVLIGAAATFAQCPTISVIGPAGVTEPGDTMIFSVDGAPAGPTYSWRVSSGVIIEGQGTLAISVAVDRSMQGTNVIATVEVTGLLSGCEKTATAVAPVAALFEGQPVDSYEALKENDERSRLDSFFAELANNPSSIGFIVLTGQRERLNARNRRIRLILRHARFRDFDVERLWFAFEAAGIRRTTLWRVPPGAELPCDNCPLVKGRDLD